jgi:hypothetical protein
MEQLWDLLGRANQWLNVWFGDGMPTIQQEWIRAAAIILTIMLVAGIAAHVLKRGSLADTMVWLISGCIFGLAITGETAFWKTVGSTSMLLAGYWLIRYFAARFDKPASKQR